MDSLPFADALFKEYLSFRGLQQTLATFSQELAHDKACGFRPEGLSELLFGSLIPALAMDQVLDFLELLNSRLYVHLDSRYDATIQKLEQSIIKCMLVTAVKRNRADKVQAFFQQHGDEMLQGVDGPHWRPWCALAFVPQPWLDPAFQPYFQPCWQQLLEVSFCNFLAEVAARLPLPTVLRFNADRRQRLQLARQVEQLQAEVHRLKAVSVGSTGSEARHAATQTDAVEKHGSHWPSR